MASVRVVFSPLRARALPHSFRRPTVPLPHHQHQQCRTLAMAMGTGTMRPEKREGDISDAFASLEGGTQVPLDPRFAFLKTRLLHNREEALVSSWNRLLEHLREQTALVREKGTAIVPEIAFQDIQSGNVSAAFDKAYRDTGVCVVRNVLPPTEALGLKESIREYVRANPHTKAFPQHDPQVYELYWSPAQVRARGDPRMLAAQRFLMDGFWRASPTAQVSLRHPVSYADRLRMRKPGDGSFALGPHMDGGSLERWMEDGYAKAGTYASVFEGRWEEYDPWDADKRVNAVQDLFGGVGNCSALRLQQAWLSLSNIKGGEGHLKVNPLLRASTAYLLLRPFFEASRGIDDVGQDAYLATANWRLEQETSSLIQGASPGHGQSLHQNLHPHLDLPRTMIHMPAVQPGDYVAWHCDTIHAVDGVHNGGEDSSVLYIPACPLTASNARYLAEQRQCFLAGKPSPDFGGGEGESRHVGRPGEEDLNQWADEDGVRAMGLREWDAQEAGLTEGEKEVIGEANRVLGFWRWPQQDDFAESH